MMKVKHMKLRDLLERATVNEGSMCVQVFSNVMRNKLNFPLGTIPWQRVFVNAANGSKHELIRSGRCTESRIPTAMPV